MQKGIGAAPFAIVAALIIAMAAGFWATQPAQAAAGDVGLVHGDMVGAAFPDPSEDTLPFGPAGRAFETNIDPLPSVTAPTTVAELEAAYARDASNVFRGEIGRGAPSFAEFRAGVDDSGTEDPDVFTIDTGNALSLMIEVGGEGSLSKTSSLSSVTCSPDATAGTCDFAVYSTGTPGGFSVTASGVAVSLRPTARGEVTLNGQFVGSATSATVLTAPPATTGIRYDDDFGTDGSDDARKRGTIRTDHFGKISPANFRVGAVSGLTAPAADAPDNVGYLFQLHDSADQVAMTVSAADRDAVLVTVTTDLGKAFQIAGTSLSNTGGANDLVYVGISQESGLGANYPAVDSGTSGAPGDTGGLVAVGLGTRTAADGGGMGRICVDVDADGACEAEVSFSAAGAVNGEMSSVSGIVSGAEGNVNLAEGLGHVRVITLRDKDGIPINGLSGADAQITVTDKSEADGDHLLFDFGKNAKEALAAANERDAEADTTVTPNIPAVDGADNPASGAISSGKDGAYYLGISANSATVGSHAFEVAIGAGNAKATKTVDADGNPLEAHIASPVRGLAITSVTDLNDNELLAGNGGAASVNAGTSTLLTIEVTATGSDGLAPINGQTVNGLTTGVGRFVKEDGATNNAGTVSFQYVFGGDAKATSLIFSHEGGARAVLLVGVSGDAAVDDGPSVYSLVGSAGSTYVSWNGGDASSSVFENVAGLVIVWKWTGSMWVGYTSSPSAPAATKTVFGLSDGDVLYVVSNGPVDVELD